MNWTYGANECGFECDTNYTYNEETNSCEADTQIGTCGGEIPDYAKATTADTFTQTWDGTAFTPESMNWTYGANECGFECDEGYHQE